MAIYARCIICRCRRNATKPGVRECIDKEGHGNTQALRWVARVQFSRSDAPMEKSFLRRGLAEKQEHKWHAEHQEGTLVKKKDAHTFAEALIRYKTEHVLKHNHAPERSTVYSLKTLRASIGQYRLSDLTLDILKDERDALVEDRDWQNATANRHFNNNVHAILEKVREWSWLEKNPAEFLDKLPEKDTVPRFLEEAEIEKLWQNITSPVLDTYALTILRTGARPDSIKNCSFDNDDVDFKNRIIWFTTYKGHNGRMHRYPVPMDKTLYPRILARYQETGGKGAVFVTANVRKLAQKAIAESKLNDGKKNKFTIYGLKHCYASHLIMNGAPESAVAKLLGHTDTKMIQKHYAHLTLEYLRKAQATWTLAPKMDAPIKLEAI